MSELLEDDASGHRKYPFANMRINDHSILDAIEGRFECPQCNRSRKFFCYTCYVPVGELVDKLPTVSLPLYIDIIKHKKEIDGKSTAIHAAILANQGVRVHTYPNIPDYRNEEGVVLIYPSSESMTISQLFNHKVRLINKRVEELPSGHNIGTMLKSRVTEVREKEDEETTVCNKLPIKRAVFIDSTWNQSRSIYHDDRLGGLRTVMLQNRASQFWRHQKGSPRWYLATIEAIHQFLLEVHVDAWGLNAHYRGLDNLELVPEFYAHVRRIKADADCLDSQAPYNGHYDNLMFFFANMYNLIHRYYDHNKLKSYRRPF